MSDIILREYQKNDVERMIQLKRCLNANPMGLGKSLESVVTVDKKSANWRRVLLAAPSHLMYGWQKEFTNWTGDRYYKPIIVTGSKVQRTKLIVEGLAQTKGLQIFIVNLEMLRSVRVKEIHAKTGKEVRVDKPLYPELFGVQWDCIIVDEFHKCSNRNAQVTQGLKKLKSEYFYGLTGTPNDGHPEDLWSLLHIIEPKKYTSYWQFVDRFCLTQPSDFNPHSKDIIGLKDPEGLQLELQPIMIRHEKKDVLPELPDKIYKEILLELEPSQKKAYNQMEKDMILTYDKLMQAEIDPNKFFQDIDETTFVRKFGTILELQMRLRQVCATPALIGGVDKSAKVDALVELISDLGNKQIVVFSWFKGFIEYLAKTYKGKYSMSVLYGGMNAEEKQKAVADFQSGKTQLFFGSIDAAGTGTNLQVADTLIMLDKSWKPIINMQVEDRIHRIGQRGTATIINTICRNTVEEDLEKALKQKLYIINQIVLANETYKLARQRHSKL